MTKTCSYDEERDEKYCWCEMDECEDCNPVEVQIDCDRCGSPDGNGFASATGIFSKKTLHLCHRCRSKYNHDGTFFPMTKEEVALAAKERAYYDD